MLTHLEPKVSTNPGGRKNNNRHSNLRSRVAEKDLKIYLWSQTSRILKGRKGKLPCLPFVLTKTRSHFWFPMLKADQCQDAKIKIEAAENTNLNLYALQFCIQDSWLVLMFWHQITFYYGADELPWLLDFQKSTGVASQWQFACVCLRFSCEVWSKYHFRKAFCFSISPYISPVFQETTLWA